jgi:myo-inositol-1(or 4)-monophosphatase
MTSRPPESALVTPLLRGFRERLLALPTEIRDKEGDLGPLTELDLLVDGEVRATLARAFPGDALISEESPDRSGGSRVWILDPVDGTRELVAGVPEWAVSLGLWEGGTPRYGWIYHPPTDTLREGGPGLGAWKDDVPARPRAPAHFRDLVVGVSRTDIRKGLVPDVDPPPRPVGSIAYKLGLVATGDLDATVSLTPKRVWDVAGGIPLLLGAGAAVVGLRSGAPLDHLDRLRLEEGFVAAAPVWIERLIATYAPRRGVDPHGTAGPRPGTDPSNADT